MLKLTTDNYSFMFARGFLPVTLLFNIYRNTTCSAINILSQNLCSLNFNNANSLVKFRIKSSNVE